MVTGTARRRGRSACASGAVGGGLLALWLLLGLAVWPHAAGAETVTFSYRGGPQLWAVPSGVTQVTFDAYGAEGATGSNSLVPGGLGGRATATLSVSPGQVLQVNVGGSGAGARGGFNGGADSASGSSWGGGGGGASDVRTGSFSVSERLLVAGGGGGGAGRHSSFPAETAGRGGAGGGLAGEDGQGAAAGGGGTASSGGAGGRFSSEGGFGGGGGGTCEIILPICGGGGGGGWYGGGGGWAGSTDGMTTTGGGGGGGSGHGPAGTAFETGVRQGHGEVVLTFTIAQGERETQTGGQPQSQSQPHTQAGPRRRPSLAISVRRQSCVRRDFTLRVAVTRQRNGAPLTRVFLDGRQVRATRARRFTVPIRARRMRPGLHRVRIVSHAGRARATRTVTFTRCADAPRRARPRSQR